MGRVQTYQSMHRKARTIASWAPNDALKSGGYSKIGRKKKKG